MMKLKYFWKLTLSDGTVEEFDANLVYPRMTIPDAPESVLRYMGLHGGRAYLSIVSVQQPDMCNLTHTYTPSEWQHIELSN